MADILDRLKAALADRYRIERELGSGGMATVYLAQDLKHERQVAVKVLRPELAAVLGPERFHQEIKIAANLHHPHILPLYDSGDADGFLYYVMPYEEGQSLRDKLAKEGELPIAEAVRILRDVIDALDHAHKQGVVHRDIKPDNVLLSERHALVTDFGVAKAVSEATGAHQLTTEGVALGTPAYMSPEQAAADKHVDHRADIYSVGALAYELLTGRPPFTGTTPQEVLAAHVTQAAEPVTKYRETVPPALAQLVMRCLEKKAADRWQSAEELLPQLEVLATPSGGITPTDTRHLTATAARRRWLVRATMVAAAALVVGGFFTVRFLQVGGPGTLIGQEVFAEHDLILVVEFQNRTDDSSLGATVCDAIRVELQQSGVVRVLGQEDMWRGLRRMELEPGGENREGVARELAEREGAKAYVTGDVSRLGAGYQLTARVVATLDETVVHTERVTAEDDQHLIEAVDDLGKQLRRSIGESLRAVRAAPELAQLTTASLPALRAFTAARRAEFAGQRRRAINLLQEALAQDTAFAAAWSFLAVLYHNNDDYSQAAEAVDRAYTFLDRLPERERLVVTGAHHSFRDEFALAEAAYSQLLELEGESPLALDNMADNMLNMHRWSAAESLSLRSIQLDPQSITSYWNAVEAQVAQRRFEAADSVLSLMAAHLPDHPWLRSLQGRVTFARRDLDAAEAYFDSVWVAGPPEVSAAVRLYSCGLKLYRGRLSEWRKCGYVSPGAALWELRYSGDTARVSGMVDSMLASESRPYPGLVTVLAEMGRIREAHQLLREWRGAFGPEDLGYRTEAGRAAGSIALAEGRPDSAVNAFLAWHRAGYVGASHVFNRGLAEAANAHDQAGRPDSAIVLYERALDTPSIWGAAYEAIWYPHALRRLGELHESLGHREQAIAYYGMFVDLWKDADPELQPQVEDVRRRIARLMGEPQP